ncbi:hypothetical protein ACTXT7_001205 [Hymenolepis weldensis]
MEPTEGLQANPKKSARKPTTTSTTGVQNNTITVNMSDFDVIEALTNMDAVPTGSSPPGEYGQVIPPNPFSTPLYGSTVGSTTGTSPPGSQPAAPNALGIDAKSSKPPLLPPQLLQFTFFYREGYDETRRSRFISSYLLECLLKKALEKEVFDHERRKVILNRDTNAQCDPNLLPQPNHVMLNHMYALSIKDGVIVLSAISRYRQKFVSTVLYKPI